MLHQAVILAAGNGRRLHSPQGELPKPLQEVGGLPLIKRAILTAKRGGIQDFVVVVGYEGEKIVQALKADSSLGVQLRFVYNQDWPRGNGSSLLAAQPHLNDEGFLIMMADHLIVPEIIDSMRRVQFGDQEIIIAMDRKVDGIFDIDDATKIALKNGQIHRIAKELSQYDGADMGVLACRRPFIEALKQVAGRQESVTLSDGVQILAEQDKVSPLDLTGQFWCDVDTPEAKRDAERALYQRLRKPTDGIISKHLNRRISLALTRLFIKWRFSVNGVWAFGALIGVLSGVFMAMGTLPYLIVGGICLQLASILDGCDGEMARLTFSESPSGEWLDTVGDNATYLSFMLGVVIGLYRQHPSPLIIYESLLFFFGLSLTWFFMFYYLKRYTTSGSLVSVKWEEADAPGPNGSGKKSWISRLAPLMRSDLFSFIFMWLAITNQLHLILWLGIIGTNGTWMTVLKNKRDRIADPLTKVEKEKTLWPLPPS